MKKYFVFTDIHGYYDILLAELNKCGWDSSNPDHIFISCGDLLDRGHQPDDCLDFVNDIPKERKILIRGNHEDNMQAAIDRRFFKNYDLHNKTIQTACDLTKTDLSDSDELILSMLAENEKWNKYISDTVDYFEMKDYIFVHGWLPILYKYDEDDTPKMSKFPSYHREYNPNWRQANQVEWEDARWLNGMRMWYEGIVEPNKTIVCGHYHTSWGHSHLHDDGKEFLNIVETFYTDPDTGKVMPYAKFEPFIDNGIIALDACTAYSNEMNCFIIEDLEEEQII